MQYKKYVLVTKSESNDYYIYFIEHSELPTNSELKNWLIINGNDIEDNYCYEEIVSIKEIKNFKQINT